MLLGKKVIGTIAYLGGITSIPEPFVWSWSQMVEFNSDYACLPNEKIHYDKSPLTYHAYARNMLVNRFRGEWLLMLDTDISFDPDLAVRMLRKMDMHKIDVLCALFQYKSPPYSPVLSHWNKEGNGFDMLGDWDKNVDLHEIGSAGAAALLVRRSVYTKIKNKLKQDPFEPLVPFSEDFSFFKRLKQLKIKAYFSPSIEVHHLMWKALSLEEDYHPDKLLIGKRIKRHGLSLTR